MVWPVSPNHSTGSKKSLQPKTKTIVEHLLWQTASSLFLSRMFLKLLIPCAACPGGFHLHPSPTLHQRTPCWGMYSCSVLPCSLTASVMLAHGVWSKTDIDKPHGLTKPEKIDLFVCCRLFSAAGWCMWDWPFCGLLKFLQIKDFLLDAS